jgi:hypothetical protein
MQAMGWLKMNNWYKLTFFTEKENMVLGAVAFKSYRILEYLLNNNVFMHPATVKLLYPLDEKQRKIFNKKYL